MNDNIALIDWDNTVRAGWTVRDWTLHLRGMDLVPARTSADVESIIERYNAGIWTYARMAEAVLQALADGLRGQSAGEVAAQAPVFIQRDQTGLYPFAKSLFAALGERGIDLVVISGAPEEVLSAAAQHYGLAHTHGTKFDIRDGRYLGTVAVNRATEAGKQDAVAPLLGNSPVCIAAGDSEADLPLLENARLSLVVGDPALASKLPNSLLIQPYDPDISTILRALDQC